MHFIEQEPTSVERSEFEVRNAAQTAKSTREG